MKLQINGETITLKVPVNLPRVLRRVEDAFIDLALERANGERKSAAGLLGLGRTTLVEKLRRRRNRGLATQAAQSEVPPI